MIFWSKFYFQLQYLPPLYIFMLVCEVHACKDIIIKFLILTFTPVSLSVVIYDGIINNVTMNIIGTQLPIVSRKNNSLKSVVSYGGYGIFCIVLCKNCIHQMCYMGHKFPIIINYFRSIRFRNLQELEWMLITVYP